jgi:SAM-dependent methyltransferase
MTRRDIQARELEHHEALYSGFAQEHFARPAVRAFRRHLAARISTATGLSRSSRLLSLGCGIGDTELLLAPSVHSIVGVDLSPAAIRQANLDTERAGHRNVEFLVGDLRAPDFPEASFDVVIAVFFLHHLPDQELRGVARQARRLLASGGMFYSLDPNRYRLSGAVGKLLVPRLMKKYQSPDERELVPSGVREIFAGSGFAVQARMYDFLSTAMAGLFPSARWAYEVTRALDNALVRIPLLYRIGGNFELIARAAHA